MPVQKKTRSPGFPHRLPETDNQTAKNGGSTNYKDGTYTGEADGFGGTIQVEVKIEKSKIAEINVISAEKEDGAYLSMAKDMIPKIIDAQSADIDTISGATFSSTGIKMHRNRLWKGGKVREKMDIHNYGERYKKTYIYG